MTGSILAALLAVTLTVAALRELLAGLDRPAAEGGPADWLRATVEPLRRARLEGYAPTSDERARIAFLFGVAAAVGGWWLVGPVAGLVFAAASPLVAGWLIARGKGRYRRSIERSLPDVSRAIADCLSAGHSARGALIETAPALEGPVRSEFEVLRYELEAGAPTAVAIGNLAARCRSRRVDAFATALVSQRLAGGDLAALLRRFAEGAAEQDRVAEDARSATAQARFTGYLVAAMPACAALFTELIAPGLFGSIARSAPALILVSLSLALQAVGFVAISKLARVGEV